ncbi:sugar phosphate isomerase/epimerase [Planctomycetales bacterium ZRK34]|nr:sugar phosphate isomerase/epimerase [Planctomycetales bacterium ZRK34]
MVDRHVTRRGVVSGAIGAAVFAGTRAGDARAEKNTSGDGPFILGLNMATIRGQKLPLDEQVTVAIEAGYGAIEPWVGDAVKFKESGGSLEDLGKRCADHGVRVTGAIGFAKWIVDDAAERARGLEQMKREMAVMGAMGGERIAAPPIGAHKADAPKISIEAAAERYHALLEVGGETGVMPELEVWGFSPNVTTLGEALHIAAACGHREAHVLSDVYHLYKGGTPSQAVRLLSATAARTIHINDYPAIDRATIGDGDRLLPGEGIAPLTQILRDFAANAGESKRVLSLELFNKKLWSMPALDAAKAGLAAMQRAVDAAMG